MSVVGREEQTPSVDLKAQMAEVVEAVRGYHEGADLERLWHAFHLGVSAHDGQLRQSGEPYFTHPIAVAHILTSLRLDADTIVAGLLHDAVEDTSLSLEDLEREFGSEVATLVDGVTKITQIKHESRERQQAENYRKMLLTMSKDVRVILIKLADRLHNMRTLGSLNDERKQRIANETLTVYAPLAHRFGIARFKWELEDLAFRTLHPAEYQEIQSTIELKRAERERIITEVKEPIEKLLKTANIAGEVSGRPKHFFSIYQKMQRRNAAIDQIYDLHAVRVLVGTTAECYAVLGLVHSVWTPLHDRLKDYVANPKQNLYQSLHTTVNGPENRLVEVQIRTHDMHRRAEMGIAAHWKYKEKGGSSEAGPDDRLDQQLQRFREVLEWQQDVSDPREFMDALKTDIFQDEIYVFSPMGDLFQLPIGSTPLDFAFYVHSQVGLRCTGARVDGRLVPLRYELKSGETVEVLTQKNAKPSKGWLNIVKTSRAKHHIRHWIKATQFEESVQLGREMLEREFKKRKADIGDLDKALIDIAQSLGHQEVETLLAAVGSGSLQMQKVANRIAPQETKRRRIPIPERLQRAFQKRGQSTVAIQGVDNLLIRFARCCQPVPGDAIRGIVTAGSGVSVHRKDCQNLQDPNLDEDRVLDVSWDVEGDEATFPVQLSVTGQDRKNLLADISRAIGEYDCNIQSGAFDGAHEYARCTFICEVRNLNHLDQIIGAIRRLPGVSQVHRSDHQVDGDAIETEPLE